MSDEIGLQTLIFEDEDGKTYTIYVQSKDADPVNPDKLPSDPRRDGTLSADEDGRIGQRGISPSDALAAQRKISQQAIRTMRGFAAFAVSSFRNVASANVSEINLKFGLKFGGKIGIPFVTEGSAESNLEVQVKFTFPEEGKD